MRGIEWSGWADSARGNAVSGRRWRRAADATRLRYRFRFNLQRQTLRSDAYGRAAKGEVRPRRATARQPAYYHYAR